LDELEPMEVVQYYTNRYHKAMEVLNVLPPSIEPHASGHIMEQIEFTQKIIDAGFAYESEGSVYFDVEKYNKSYNYGKLSGRNIEDMLETTRDLDGQSENAVVWILHCGKSIARAYHAVESALERRFSGLAYRMFGYGDKILRRRI